MTLKIVSSSPEGKSVYENYEDFHQANWDRVVRYLAKRCSSWDDAEDIASQAFVYCYQHWDAYDPAKASQSSWLFMIVSSRLKNYYRDRRLHVDIDEFSEVLTDGGNEMEAGLRLDGIRQDLADALQSLPDKYRDALVMRYYGDKTDQEIALALGTSTGNVRVLVHRAAEKLRKLLPEGMLED